MLLAPQMASLNNNNNKEKQEVKPLYMSPHLACALFTSPKEIRGLDFPLAADNLSHKLFF